MATSLVSSDDMANKRCGSSISDHESVSFPVEIIGPDNGWIKDDATPPVLLNTPGQQGEARQFFEIQEG